MTVSAMPLVPVPWRGRFQNIHCLNRMDVERINEIISSKKEIAELTVQKGEKWLGDLSKSELRSFLAMSEG